MYIVQSLCKYYVTYQGHMMGAKMERDMRRELLTITRSCLFPITAGIIPVR